MIKLLLRYKQLSFFLLTSMLIPVSSLAQKQSSEAELRARELEIQQEILKFKELEIKLLESAFEQTIDPKSYIVGPGDYLLIDLGGELQRKFQLPVTPEGDLVIPTVGSLTVDGLTLEVAKVEIEKAVLKKYRKISVSTYLLALRKIRVHVTGEVLNPGTFIATPVDRLSDLIYRSGGLKNNALLDQVEIRHRDQSESFIDYSEFLRNGRLDYNPMLQTGDIILVRRVDYSKASVRVEGHMDSPGYYPLRSSNENILEFLTLHDLLTNNQNLKEIVLVREGKDFAKIDITGGLAHKTILKAGDLIRLPKEIRQVYVTGSVLKPGPYAYVDNLTAKDYVGQAGATGDAAGPGSFRVHHIATGRKEKGELSKVHPGDIIEVPGRRTRRLSEYLQIASTIATLIIAYSAVRK